jgi:hypothetical protein
MVEVKMRKRRMRDVLSASYNTLFVSWLVLFPMIVPALSDLSVAICSIVDVRFVAD